MNICLINNLYPPYAKGGAEQVVRVHAELFREKGYRVVVITSKPWAGKGSWKPERTVEDKGIIVYRYFVPNIAYYGLLNRHSYIFKLLWHVIDIFNFWSAEIVKNILREEEIHVIWSHNLMGMGFAIPRMVQDLKRVHAHTLHDVQLVEPSGILPWNHTKDSWLQSCYSRIMKWQMGRPDMVTAPSRFLKQFYEQRGFFAKTKIDVVRNEFSIFNFQFSKKQNTQINKQNTQIHFLFVGALVEHKGIRVLMRAWEKKSLTEAVLHIVGSGELEPEVRTWARKRHDVVVCGRLEREKLQEIYEMADVLLFTSVCIENSPMVIAEAIAYGLFIIAADTGGVKEPLEHYRRSVLVTPEDSELLTQIINKFEKARVYLTQPERFGVTDDAITMQSDHGTRVLSVKEGKWVCDCDFFSKHDVCSHLMALWEIRNRKKH